MWQRIEDLTLTARQRSWLADRDSLTLRIGNHTKQPVLVDVLSSGTQQALPDERQLIELSAHGELFCREVVLRIAEQPLVIARSVCAIPALQGSLGWLREYGDKSLAQSLFVADDGWQRGTIEACYTSLAAGFVAAAAAFIDPGAPLLARRSLFSKHGASLLVKEVFLPEFWELA